MQEVRIIDKPSRLYNIIHRAFDYNQQQTVWFYSKKTKARLKKHSDLCFDHAHRMIKKQMQDSNWDRYRIGLHGRVSNGDFRFKIVNFQIKRIDDEITNET